MTWVTLGNIALWIDITAGLGLAVVGTVWLLDRATRRVVDMYIGYKYLLEYVTDRAGRERAKKAVDSRRTVTEYREVQP